MQDAKIDKEAHWLIQRDLGFGYIANDQHLHTEHSLNDHSQAHINLCYGELLYSKQCQFNGVHWPS